MENNAPRTLVPSADAQQAQRALLTWLNTYTGKPCSIVFESLPDDDAGMSIGTIQAAYKIRSYILGGYMAQYQFGIYYQVLPSDEGDQLNAVEALDAIGAWAESNTVKPTLTGARVRSVKRDTNAAIYAARDDGTKIYQILMSMTWEVF